MKKKKIVDLYKGLGEKIRLARLAKGLTGNEVAIHLGVSEQQVLKYERAEARIPIDRLVLIAEITDMSLTYFLEDYNDATAMSSDEAQDLVRSTSDLVRMWQLVPTPERMHLLAVIRSAAGE